MGSGLEPGLGVSALFTGYQTMSNLTVTEIKAFVPSKKL